MCIYRINYINSIKGNEVGIYFYMMFESVIELCWVEKYLVWFRVVFVYGRMRNEMFFNEFIYKFKS